MERSDHRATELIGMSVVDSRGEEVGEIDDLIVSPNDGRIEAVLALGGVLGLGERLVSIPIEDLEIETTEQSAVGGQQPAGNSDQHVVRLRMTSEELIRSRPEFQYPDERTARVR